MHARTRTRTHAHTRTHTHTQDEQYNHIEESEMEKVREAVAAKREWMNVQMAALTQLPKHTNPPIKCSEIRAEKAVRSRDYIYLATCSPALPHD